MNMISKCRFFRRQYTAADGLCWCVSCDGEEWSCNKHFCGLSHYSESVWFQVVQQIMFFGYCTRKWTKVKLIFCI